MAAVWQASGTLLGSTGADITPVIPAHTANDILVCIAASRVVTETCATPSGWTLKSGPVDTTGWRTYVFYKRAASGSETNPLLDWSAATGEKYGQVHTFRGATVTGDPFSAAVLAADLTDPIATTGITTVVAGKRVIVVGIASDNLSTTVAVTSTDPATYTLHHYSDITTGADAAGWCASNTRSAAGATGTVTSDFDQAMPAGAAFVAELKEDAADTALAGSSAGVATSAGVLTTAIRFAGAAAAVATAAAILTTGIALAGLSAGQATVSGAMSSLVGASGGSSSAAAALTTQIALAGPAPGSSSAAASLTTGIPLAGASPGAGGASASLTTQVALAGSSAGQAAAGGALTTSIPLAGQSAGASSAAGDLTTQVALAGSSAGEAWAQGVIVTAGDTALAGSTTGQAAASASLTTSIPLAGASTGASTAVGALTTQIALSGLSAGSSSAAATFSGPQDRGSVGAVAALRDFVGASAALRDQSGAEHG